MEPTIKCGKHLAKSANLSESEFHDVNLHKAVFDDVNLSGATFHNINFSDVSFSAAQMGGTKFQHIGMPPDENENQKRQKPLTFDGCHLNDSSFTNCKLSNVKIENCEIDGMTIDGHLVTDIIDAYNERTGI